MKKIYILLVTLFFYFNVNSQFTYINVSGGYEGLPLHSDAGSTLTGVKSFTTSISAVSRFKRHFGIGAKFSLPLSQSFDFSFKNSETSSGVFFEKKITDILIHGEYNRYYADQYNYNVSYQNLISLFGRIYFEKFLNFYSDISISMLKVNESFHFFRTYKPATTGSYTSTSPEIPEQKFEFDENHLLFSPGLKLGLSPHITDNLYIDFNLSCDFLFFKGNSFEFITPYDYNPVDKWHRFVTFESQASGLKSLFSANLGIGFYF